MKSYSADTTTASDFRDCSIGVIGLGNLGLGIASNLARTHSNVFGYDVESSVASDPRLGGVKFVNSVRSIAKHAELICVCVNTEDQLEFVVDEILRTASRTCRAIAVHSTVRPSMVIDLAKRAGNHGIEIFNSPVSGGPTAAFRGQLTLILGGSDTALEAYLGIFLSIASRIFFVGDVGRAQAAKLINNILFQMHHHIVVEALELAIPYGLDEKDVMEIVNVSTGRSWITENWGYLDNQIEYHRSRKGVDGALDLMTKDQILALDFARQLSVELPLTALLVNQSKNMLKRRLAVGQGEPILGKRHKVEHHEQ